MLKRRLPTVIAAVCLAVLLGYGLLRLFAIRWERGDVYPSYSTLRADPLGTRALYEAVDSLPGIEARRNYRPLQQLRPQDPVTLVYAAVPRRSEWGREELRHFESLVANGSRAVFAFTAVDLAPEKSSPKPSESKEANQDDKPVEAAKPEDEKPEPKKEAAEAEQSGTKPKEKETERRKRPLGEGTVSFHEVAERWGFHFDVATGTRAGSFHGLAKTTDTAPELEKEVSWHSALRFKELQPPWRVLYRAAGEAVLIERRWGDGSIVLASDSYFLSNEALMKERNSQLLAWLIGTPRTIVFDEEHLGVAEDTGLLSLARKYRLQGALAALAFVALLWLWRQSIRLVPVQAGAQKQTEYVAGLDSHAGFISLLRRSVPPSKTLEVCVTEWQKSFSHDRPAIATVEQALANSTPANPRKADPAAIYHAISRALKERKNPTV